MRNKPAILITPGDLNGIGPEVTQKALKDTRIRHLADFQVVESSDKTGFESIKKAVEILKRGRAQGLITAPVNKAAINKSGVSFTGHTEYLASATHTKKFAMMFCGGVLKITLVTRHIPLKRIPEALSVKGIVESIILTNEALTKYFKIHRPKIGVCGLNPHCGENGLIGTEEKDVIIPAIRRAKKITPHIQGPLPADVIFHMAYNERFDAVISMYHDQGLGPLKMIAFQNGINVTLGLPFVRTSPDHGTAYDIAGKGIANPDSMKEAIKLAVKMCL